MRLRIALLAALLAAVYLVVAGHGGDDVAVPSAAPAPVAVSDVGHDAEGELASPPPVAVDEAHSPPAPSQQGSEVDGAIAFDAFGRLIVDRELRRLFDYHLAAIGELDIEEIRASLHALAQEAGGAHGAAQVLAAFARYLEYLDQVDRLVLPAQADLLDRLEALHALRRQYLGNAVAESYFADEEAAALDLIARVEDAAAGMATVPADDTDLALEQTLQFEREGTDAVTRQAERSALFGDAAALRLAALDEERERWRQRVDDYQSARAAIIDDPSLTAPARDAALLALLEQSFDEAERRRVLSLLDDG
ncbi:MAG TPA: lipase secretion chaperone [Xanthomonadaceae bacterium]|nr:lipase secretion chaperone [Xanthomonadaceae bacterium]